MPRLLFAFVALLSFQNVFSYTPKTDTDQITVRLATDNQLLPLYLAKFVSNNSGMEASYLDQLEDVLQFDLNHNGFTYTLPHVPEREKLANALSTGDISQAKAWQALKIYYVIKVHVGDDKGLSAIMLSVNGDAMKNVGGLKLVGDMAKDRRTIHLLADAIHKSLFGTDGIASTHVLYTVRKKTGTTWSSEIWEADYDGQNAHSIMRDTNYNINPVYVPPKSGKVTGGFFYVGYQAAQPKIFLASLKEGVGRRLSYLSGNQLMPAISRQRDKIAFISDVTGNPDLFLQAFSPEEGAIGKPQQIFAAKKATQGTPTFSPDGKRIAFVSNKDGSPKIYVINVPAPGTPLKDITAQLVTRHSKESSAPAWSPDGSKLAYCAKADGFRQIWVYDFNSKDERQLTQGPNNKENPTWAPNSLSLIYNTSDANACELYLINVNQPNATKITSGPGEKRFPNWEPRT